MTFGPNLNADLSRILQSHERGSDLVRGELARLIDRLSRESARSAAAAVVAAVEAVAEDLGHPSGCDCGDEIDRFVRGAAAAAAVATQRSDRR